MIITSAQNPYIKQIAALREAKVRREKGLTLIDGKREVERASAAGADILEVIHCPELLDGALKLSGSPKQVEVSKGVFEKIAYGERIDGVVAVVRPPQWTVHDLKISKTPLVVVVEGVEKPGNLGAIIRTCDSAGVDALLIAGTVVDIYNPNVIRTSVSTVFALPVVGGSNEEILAFLRKKCLKTAAALVQAKTAHTQADLKGPLAIVLGSEDKGLSDFWQKHCDVKVRIPMKGLADSLNVSVSAAVLIFEALRQRS